ncbi:GNAT family N-acetyltransferase [Gemmatimonas sp.]|jgi:putative hemolysin|uniref:GNAT family N-acetyltransferase n=1 Tax=Gemmatimonas sp. TaxID=1962908 RepID=UPI0037C0F3A4
MLARAFDASTSPFRMPVNEHEAAIASLEADVFPHHVDSIPPGIVESGKYDLRFAWSRQDLHAVQALRYRVFCEELGEGLASSSVGSREADERDPWFHHLMICERSSGAVVGTYRLQTAVMAATRHGFYSATLFELGAVPGKVLAGAVEIGRACVDPAHRSGRVLRLLWKGIARYLQWNDKRYLFGCCSLDGVAEQPAVEAWRALHARQALHDRILVRPRPAARALPDDGRVRPQVDATSLTAGLPPLFEGYLSLGARVCGAPALDHAFGTTDFLVLLDVQDMDARSYASLFD